MEKEPGSLKRFGTEISLKSQVYPRNLGPQARCLDIGFYSGGHVPLDRYFRYLYDGFPIGLGEIVSLVMVVLFKQCLVVEAFETIGISSRSGPFGREFHL